MKITKTKLSGVFIIEPNVFQDERGKFIKIFNKDIFKKYKMAFNFEEGYYSISKRNVLRGMHFQTPPKDHSKLVYVTSGAILDVILDIRKGSPTYGKYISIELSDKNHKVVYIPRGFAHGFLSLKNNSCVIYSQTTTYSPEHDSGIKIDSFGMKWSVKNPIISKRDQNFPTFEKYEINN